MGKSSLNGELVIEMESIYSHDNMKKELSSNSCLIIIKNE